MHRNWTFLPKKRGTNQSLNYNKAYIKWVLHFLLLILATRISFLWARVEEQFQFFLEFLGLNVVVSKNFDLLVTVEHVNNNSPSLIIYLHKTRLKEKVEHVEEEKLGSKVDLQKMKVEHVEEGSTLEVQIEIVD